MYTVRRSWSRRHCTAVGVVFARPTRAVIAPWSCRRRAIVVPLSRHRRAVVTPSSRHRSSSCELSSCGLHHAACVVAWGSHRSGGGGLRSESTCGSGVGGGHRWGQWRSRSWQQTHTRLRKKKLAEAESAAWERPKSPSPPPPPPCSTQARGRRLQPIATYKSAAPRDDRNPDSVGHDGATTTARPRRPTAPTQPRCNSTRKRRRRDHNSVGHDATTTPYSAQEPPQRYPHTARNPHRYDTNDDGDAAAGTARSWAGRAGRTMQQELSSSGGPRGCRRQWLHGQWWQQQRDYRSDGGSM
ncbi:hypothetical protein EDB83DRAFT_2549461 [Lactarius deliciosus]|nr:hypothetical protein EDB83DRAFT_2549461 [Lactarius deliciosus]